MLGKLGLLSVVVALFSYVYFTYIKSVPSPVLQIADGKIQGIISVGRNGQEYYSYMGIPYAKPPTGLLRFESPVPIEPWSGILDASAYQSECLQYEGFTMKMIHGSEDCLFVNVFVPKTTKEKSLPVMAYIHGGYFHVGGPQTSGPGYFMGTGEVIIISIQYRLGALGFMSTGDSLIRGNMGLKDTLLGLKWIQKNAKYFGGDSSRVTIFGESAGGCIVSHHVASPKSKGLFSRAIHQAGSAIHYWTTYRNVKAQAKYFSEIVGCPTENSKEMVSCLKNMDGKSLLAGHRDFAVFPRPHIAYFVPTIEVIKDNDAFITEEPLDILQSGRFNKVPMFTGCNSGEGIIFSAFLAANQSLLNEANDDWENWAPSVLHYPKELKTVSAKIRKFYFGDENKPINSTKFIQNYTNMFGDRVFTIGTSQSAKIQSEFVPTYLYYFDHQGGFSLGRLISNIQGRFNPIVNVLWGELSHFIQTKILGKTLPHIGTSHGDEIGVLYSGAFAQMSFNKETDELISKDMVQLWVDFAMGKETLKFRDIEWPVSTKNSLKFLRLSNNPAIINEPFEERRKFWESLNLPLV